MIGGTDIIIPVAHATEALDIAVRAAMRMWPNVVIEDAITGESFRHYQDINFAGRHEILAFRDPESAKLWDEIGADPSLDGTLVHFLVSENELTVAIDANPSAEIRAFVERLRQILKKDSLNLSKS